MICRCGHSCHSHPPLSGGPYLIGSYPCVDCACGGYKLWHSNVIMQMTMFDKIHKINEYREKTMDRKVV